MKIEYGTVEEEITIDAEGSTKSITMHYRGGTPVKVTRYKIRNKVQNQTEELGITMKYRKQHPDKNVTFSIEHPKGKNDGTYYVVVSWEE